MDESGFRNWMEQQSRFHTARTYAARCHRIETELNLDLDVEYRKDIGQGVIDQLAYSKKEYKELRQPMCGIILNPKTNMYSCMNSLRSSAKRYFEYMDEIEQSKLTTKQ